MTRSLRRATTSDTDYSDARRITTTAALGITLPGGFAPDSLNLFMNIPWQMDGSVEFANCLCKPGDYTVFRAEMDCVVAFSACPQDILPINNGITTEAHYEIMQ
jgi:uncharacterized protein